MSNLRLVKEISIHPVSLTDGIGQLERGGPRPDLVVDLGNGDLARADGPLGQAGLTQRLLGHRLLLALANDPPQCLVELPARKLDVSPMTKELLDLARVVS